MSVGSIEFNGGGAFYADLKAAGAARTWPSRGASAARSAGCT